MAVPNFQVFLRPVLEALHGGATANADIRAHVSTALRLTDDDLAERLTSGQTRFANRCYWAIVHLTKAKLAERVERGVYRLTDRGREVLEDTTRRVDVKFLKSFPAYREFCKPREPGDDVTGTEDGDDEALTPEERIEAAIAEIESELADELLRRIVDNHFAFFERVVLELILAMGYGNMGGGQRTRSSKDGGVDGIVSEDALGLSVILLQAKRYQPENTIGIERVKEFAGTLDERGAVKGVFVTTSRFTSGAIDYAQRSPKAIVLMDGERLARLMIQYGVGVRTTKTVELRKIDLDYFNVDE